MTTNSILTQDHPIDKIIFSLRGWLNWAVIAGGIARENARRWPASWLADVLGAGLVTVLLAPAWALYRLGAWVGKSLESDIWQKLRIFSQRPEPQPEPYATIPVGTALVLEIQTEPPALVIRKNGDALVLEPNELMALAGALTIAGGGLPELLATKGILWER
jgi:hypothetical protein